MPNCDARKIGKASRCRELAAHGVEEGCTPLARACDAGLRANVRNQVRDHEGHDQHHSKGDQILQIRDREGEARRNETKSKAKTFASAVTIAGPRPSLRAAMVAPSR